MPSFDLVSKVDMQEVDNTVNNTLKEVATRYDFRDQRTEVVFDRKEKVIHLVAADSMKMDALREMLLNKAGKRNIDLRTFKFEDPQPTSAGALKRDVKIREGVEQETAKKIVRMIKDSKIKVQASIQGDQVRISGKQIDDLRAVIALVRAADLDVPLQDTNYKS